MTQPTLHSTLRPRRLRALARALIRRALAVVVLAGTLSSVAGGLSASVASAAPPNDYLCAAGMTTLAAAVKTAYALPMSVELSTTPCSAPTPDLSTNQTVSFIVEAGVTGASVVLSPNATVSFTNGIASVRGSANATAGALTVIATSSATYSNPVTQSVTFTLLNSGVSSATITPGLGAFQATPTGSPFNLALAVTVTDSTGKPVAGEQVTFSAPTYGPSGTFSPDGSSDVTVISDPAGIAVAPTFTANSTSGAFLVFAVGSDGLATAVFSLVNDVSATVSASSASPLTLSSGESAQNVVISGSDFANGAVAKFSNPGITVNSVTYVGPTTLTLNVSVAASALDGPTNLTVVDPNGLNGVGVNILTVVPAALPKLTTLTIGFVPNSPSLRGSDTSRLRAYAKGLTSGASVDFVGYAFHNESLALARARAAVRFVESVVHGVHAHVRAVTSARANITNVRTLTN